MLRYTSSLSQKFQNYPFRTRFCNTNICPWIHIAALVNIDRRLDRYTRDHLTQTTSLTNLPPHTTPPGTPLYIPQLHGILPIHGSKLYVCTYVYTSVTSIDYMISVRTVRRHKSSPKSVILPIRSLSSSLQFYCCSPFLIQFNLPFLIQYDSDFPILFNSNWKHFIFNPSHRIQVPVKSHPR